MTLGLLRRQSGGRAMAIAALVRARFGLDASDVVTVAELRCGVPGCPPVETVALILAGDRRYRLRVFRPLAEVTEDDLPPRWYLPALEDAGDTDGGCC